MKLSGVVCIRNGHRLDYCFELAGQSLLGVCDELVIADCDSDDGTRETIDAWAKRDSCVKVCNFPWTNPKGSNRWWIDFLNYGRQHASGEWVCMLDADEILHENSYELVRRAADNRATLLCHRYNFWRDAQSIIPKGHCCGYEVLRIGPQNAVYPSDYPRPDGLDRPLLESAVKSNVEIMHYGFLRERNAFFRKAREVLRIWNDAFDPRLEAAEKEGGNWMTHSQMPEWVNQLVPFTGSHPALAQEWLKQRGYHA